MANVFWVGLAATVPDAFRVTVGAAVAGTSYGFDANGRSVRYLAVTGDTTDSVTAGIISAAANSTDPRIRELRVAQNTTNTSVFDVTGASNGRPITGFAVTTGLTSSTLSTATGKNHADNVANYSTGGLPAASDNLIFDGLAADDGPMFALTAITNTLTLVDVLPTYLGRIGLPPVAPTGYAEFREQFLTLKTAGLRVRSNSPGDADGRFRINGGATASVIRASGAGGVAGTYPLHLHNFPSTSTLDITSYGVSTCPVAGQSATFASVTATERSALAVNSGTTPGNVTIDNSAGYVDCTYATLTIRNATNALSGPNAACSTATVVACSVESGVLDWRSPSKPADQVLIGTNARLITRFALGSIPAFTIQGYENGVFDDTTGRVALPQTVNLNHCAPTQFTIIKPEHIKVTLDTLP